MKKLMTFNGAEVLVETQIVEGKIWAHWPGRTLCLSDLSDMETNNKKNKTKKNRGRSGDIVSPMPGKISKVLVQVQQNVLAGQVLVVMEAMKMEYTLKAEVDGCIESISAQVGEQVTLGKVLLHIQEKK